MYWPERQLGMKESTKSKNIRPILRDLEVIRVDLLTHELKQIPVSYT